MKLHWKKMLIFVRIQLLQTEGLMRILPLFLLAFYAFAQESSPVVEVNGNQFQPTTIVVKDTLTEVVITGRCVRLEGIKKPDEDIGYDPSISCHLWRVSFKADSNLRNVRLYTMRGYWHYHPSVKPRLPENHPDKITEGDWVGAVSLNGADDESPFKPKQDSMVLRFVSWAQDLLDATVDPGLEPRAQVSKGKLITELQNLSKAFFTKP